MNSEIGILANIDWCHNVCRMFDRDRCCVAQQFLRRVAQAWSVIIELCRSWSAGLQGGLEIMTNV